MIRGLILRSHLVVILTEKLFEGDEDDELENAIKSSLRIRIWFVPW